MSTEDKQSCIRTLSEKGRSRYVKLRDEHLANITSAFAGIRTEINRIRQCRDDLASLQEIKNSISVYASRPEILTETYLNFLKRTNSTESLKDRDSLMDTDRNYKAEIDSAFALIKELASRLLKEDAPSTVASSIGSTASRKRAKAEAARAKLEFARREAELRQKQALLDQEIAIEAARTSKQKAGLEAELDLLTHKKELAAAEAEAEALESEQLNSQSVQSRILPNLPIEDAIGRRATYVNCHVQPALQPALVENYLVENYQDPDPVLNPKAPAFTPDWTSLVLRKEFLLSRISSFSNRPEMYAAWKATFRCIVNELSLSPMEELDLMIKWLGPESRRQAMSIKTSNARDPQKGLERIWERLEERYGAPEMVETSLKQKLAAFPKLTRRDTKKLYELVDILPEVEPVKEDQQYSLLLSYFDTSAGVIPIVNKLPVGLQENGQRMHTCSQVQQTTQRTLPAIF